MRFSSEISIIAEYIEYSFDIYSPIFIISMIISESRIFLIFNGEISL